MSLNSKKNYTEINSNILIFISGQQFADQIRQANPELLEQLRSAMGEAKKDKEDENPDKQEN